MPLIDELRKTVPKKEPLEYRVLVRLSAAEGRRIEALAGELNSTKTAVIRALIQRGLGEEHIDTGV